MWYVECDTEVYIWFNPWFPNIVPKMLGISGVVQECLLYANEMTGGWGSSVASRWMLVASRTKAKLEGWSFQPYWRPPVRGEWLEIELIINVQWLNKKYLHNGTSIKTLKRWGSESIQVGDHSKGLGGERAHRGPGSCTHSSSPRLSCASLPSDWSDFFYNKPVITLQ